MNSFTANPIKTVKPIRWIGALQGLRAIAFLAIFLSHSGIGPFGCFGAWGVSLFLMMSGFLMSYRYLQKSNTPTFGFSFVWSKLKKLYPLHIIMMIAKLPFAFVYLFRGWISLALLLVAICLNVTLLQIWIPNESLYTLLNGPSWFMCVIALAYLFFPLFLSALRNIDSVLSAFKMLMIFIIVHVFFSLVSTYLLKAGFNPEYIKWLTYYFPPVRCCDFGIGGILGWLYLHRASRESSHHESWFQISCLLFCFLLVAASMYVYTYRVTILGLDSFMFSLLFLPSTMLLIWLLSTATGVVEKAWSIKPLQWVAEMSPYAFLIHDVVIRYVWIVFQMCFSDAPRLIGFLVSLLLTLFLSYLWRKLSTNLQFDFGAIAIDRVRQGK